MRAPIFEVIQGDVLSVLRSFHERSVQASITSPPYWGLRSYLPEGHPDKIHEIGAEKTPQEYVEKLVAVFREVRRVLRDDGVLWLNLGDSYARQGGVGAPGESAQVGTTRAAVQGRNCEPPPGTKAKDLIGIPWTVALALRADGWWLRADVVWAKGVSGQKQLEVEVLNAMLEEGVDAETATRVIARLDPYVGNCMPSSVDDRPTTSHEYVFLLAKSPDYFYDHFAIKEEAAQPDRKRADTFGGTKNGVYHSPSVFHGSARRNMRSVLAIPTAPFPGAHFATFGESLVEPLLRAGSSEAGCCDRCGAPRQRVVEEGEPDEERRRACGADATGGYSGQSTKDHAASGVQDASAVKARILAGMVRKTTIGWRPTCECGAGEQPCLVLDPFCGSGTVGAVCQREGRDFVGIELSAENADMARARIADPDYARKVRAEQRAKKIEKLKSETIEAAKAATTEEERLAVLSVAVKSLKRPDFVDVLERVPDLSRETIAELARLSA